MALVAGVFASAALLAAAEPAGADLTTFGFGNARLGSTPSHVGISPATAARLKLAWRTKVGGAVNGQPVIADGVRVGRRVRNLMFVGTGHGQVVALDASSGSVVWRRNVGARRITPDCDASPDGVFGVYGTLAIDRSAGRVYAVDANGRAWAFQLGSGKVVAGWPVSTRSAAGEFVWGALTLSRGWLYVAVASLCDLGDYNGGIVAINLGHPAQTLRWLTVPGALTAEFGGGIWGWGGVSVDHRTGDVYAATGNSLPISAPEDEGYSEAVVRLSSRLVLEQYDKPLHPPFKSFDRDFGTTPVLIDARGCPAQTVAINKDGELFLYDRDAVSAGPRQRIWVASPTGVVPLYGVPAFDPATRTLVLTSPSTPSTHGLRVGIQALTLTSRCRFAVRWSRPFDPPSAGSAPTIAGGVIYLSSGRTGFLHALRLSDGRELWSWSTNQQTFAALAIDHGTVFDADWAGQVWAFRPAR
jgi:outer membrane protein assembly factor BamB